jgi:hypothetical protein
MATEPEKGLKNNSLNCNEYMAYFMRNMIHKLLPFDDLFSCLFNRMPELEKKRYALMFKSLFNCEAPDFLADMGLHFDRKEVEASVKSWGQITASYIGDILGLSKDDMLYLTLG